VKTLIKTCLGSLPGGKTLLRKVRLHRLNKSLQRFPDSKAIFDHYYKTGFWGSEESASGPGSTIDYTAKVRKGIAEVIKRLDVRRVLDAPCGDFNWFRLVERGEHVHYTGADIVAPLIAENTARYANKNTSFVELDITRDPLPEADLWVCRDVFLHFCYQDIFLTMQNFARSGARYLLATSYPTAKKNIDNPTGSARPVNLLAAPFDFGEPLEYIDDYIEGYPVRCLCLWERNALLETLSQNRKFQQWAKA
jgi:SAM-dependent methyltransferase